MKTRALLAALFVLVAWSGLGCECGGYGSSESFVIHETCGATITAPAALGIAGTPSVDNCVGGSSGCEVGEACLQFPLTCNKSCFFYAAGPNPGHGPELFLQFELNPFGSPSLTLPDERVKVTAGYITCNPQSCGTGNTWMDPLTVSGGSLSVRLVRNHFESAFSVALTNSAGDTIRVENGSYVINAGNEPYCPGT